jgi:uncharacterized protein (TIGR03067 family)
MSEMIETEKPHFAQTAAKASWILFLITLVVVMLSPRLHSISGAIILLEGVAFLTMTAGAICGIVGLLCMERVGAGKVLLPALIGIILNGLLLFIFITNFVTARRAALQQVQARGISSVQRAPARAAVAPTIVGTWEARLPRGDALKWIFTSSDFTMVIAGQPTVAFPYVVDFTKTPAWLTVRADNYGKPQMLMIVEFTTDGRMRVLGSEPGSQTRPANFDGKPNEVLTFSKQL